MRGSRIIFVILAFVVVASVVVSLSGIRSKPGTTPQPTPTPMSQSTPTPVPGYLVYADDENGFAFLYPEDWEQIPEDTYGEVVLVAFRGDFGCSGMFPSVSVGIRELPGSISVQSLFEQQQAYLATLEGYAPMSTEELVSSGLPAIEHQYSIIKDEVTVNVAQLLLIEGTTAWLVSCESASGCWDTCEPMFDTSLASFTV